MRPTDPEWQAAADAAGKAIYESRVRQAQANPELPPVQWEALREESRNAYREAILPFLAPALESLPDRLRAIRDLHGEVDPESTKDVVRFHTYVGTLLAGYNV